MFNIKIVLRSIALAVLVGVLTIGCGGGGGGGGGNPLESRLQTLFNNANAENLNGTMAQFSPDYLNSCVTWTDARDIWLNSFNTPNYSERYTNLHVTSFWISEPFGYAEFDIHLRVVDNGVVTDDSDYSYSDFFILENGTWRLYGDQECVRPSPSAPTKPMGKQSSIARVVTKK